MMLEAADKANLQNVTTHKAVSIKAMDIIFNSKKFQIILLHTFICDVELTVACFASLLYPTRYLR